MGLDVERVGLSNLLGGLAVERFDDELQRVLQNIVDPNTAPNAKREITLKVSIKPSNSRDFGGVEVAVTSKLAPAAKVESRIFISATRGGPVATEHNPNQPPLPFAEQAKIVSINPTGANKP